MIRRDFQRTNTSVPWGVVASPVGVRPGHKGLWQHARHLGQWSFMVRRSAPPTPSAPKIVLDRVTLSVDPKVLHPVRENEGTAKLTLPTNIVRCGMSTWRKTASPGMTAANCTSAPIQSVTVNGNDWKDFDRAKEVVKLRSVRETAIVEASYK